MVLLAPSIKALQTLIDLCSNFAGENEILYNKTKTQCMAFRPRSYTQFVLPLVALNKQKQANELYFIPITPSLKFVIEAVYLGHNISSDLKDDSDVYKQVKMS